MKKLKYWPGEMKRWYNRPFLCVLGRHHLKTHPGDHTVVVCTRCLGESEWS